ncbi:MAG TPA: OmpA family protein [Azospira sp.]|nr:OmpA family protein [Azospira sp.]
MTTKFAKKSLLVLLAAGLSLGASMAQAQTTDKGAYLTDVRNEVARSGFGLCWRTGYWTPAAAIAECDPDLVKKADGAKDAGGVKPVGAKVTLSADALFDFDKAVLRAEGKSKLDELVAKAKQINLEVIIAVGHADRIGKDAYNQKLSERRAAAVKEYLVSKGIEANRVYTEGKGEKQPVTGDKCGKSEKKTQALIECLQPDRRVEIEVIGTK